MSEYAGRISTPSDPIPFTSEREDGEQPQQGAEPRYVVGYRVTKHILNAYQEMAILMFEEKRIPAPRIGALVQYAVEHFAYQFSIDVEKRMGDMRVRRLREKGIGDIYDPLDENKSLTPSIEGEL